MKYEKILKTILFSLVLVFSMTSSVFASTSAKSVESSLRALGVSECYIGITVEYLQKMIITDSQEQSLLSYINKA